MGGWLGGGFARLGLGLRSWAGSRGREERGRCGFVCVAGGCGGVAFRAEFSTVLGGCPLWFFQLSASASALAAPLGVESQVRTRGGRRAAGVGWGGGLNAKESAERMGSVCTSYLLSVTGEKGRNVPDLGVLHAYVYIYTHTHTHERC